MVWGHPIMLVKWEEKYWRNSKRIWTIFYHKIHMPELFIQKNYFFNIVLSITFRLWHIQKELLENSQYAPLLKIWRNIRSVCVLLLFFVFFFNPFLVRTSTLQHLLVCVYLSIKKTFCECYKFMYINLFHLEFLVFWFSSWKC